MSNIKIAFEAIKEWLREVNSFEGTLRRALKGKQVEESVVSPIDCEICLSFARMAEGMPGRGYLEIRNPEVL